VFYDEASKKLHNPNLFKFYAFGMPMVSIRGRERIKKILEKEFDPEGVNTLVVSKPFALLFGDESVLYEKDKAKHGLMRRLGGAAMTPTAIAQAVPAIQSAADHQVDVMLATDGPVEMEQICNDFTLDVAWKQILGLDLDPKEVPIFRQAVKDWVNGLFNPIYLILPFQFPGFKRMKAYKARQYLVDKVEDKLRELDQAGPDGSTLSGIYFATDDLDQTTRKLTRKQVIDNAIILILAGSETSASTLTVATLLLGLHPDAWNKLKQEQQDMIAKVGKGMSKKDLDEQCPWLDAVIRETLRLRPVPSTEVRQTKSSIVMEGQQIPKDWMVLLNVRQTHENDPKTVLPDGSHMDIKLGFKPERWLDEKTKPDQWIPFGEGARRCMGERLAMTEMKVFLATLARRVDFDLASSTDQILWKKMTVMPRPLDGTRVYARESVLA
jgi:cytochrome P450